MTGYFADLDREGRDPLDIDYGKPKVAMTTPAPTDLEREAEMWERVNIGAFIAHEDLRFARRLLDEVRRERDAALDLNSDNSNALLRENARLAARVEALTAAIDEFIEHCNKQEHGWYSDGVAGLVTVRARASTVTQDDCYQYVRSILKGGPV